MNAISVVDDFLTDDDVHFTSDTLKPLISKAIKDADIQANVAYFENGNELLHEFEENRMFDIVILDIDMPSTTESSLRNSYGTLKANFVLLLFRH